MKFRHATALTAAFCFALAATGCSNSGGSSGGDLVESDCHPDGQPIESELTVSTSGGAWADQVQEAFVAQFEEQCGVTVVQTSDDRTYANLKEQVATGNHTHDIGSTRSSEEFPRGVSDGIFHTLPDGFWDDISDQMVEGSITENGAWSTPYGDVLVYNPEVFPEGMNGWEDFWDTDAYPGKRALQDDPMSFVIALLADGVPQDGLFPLDIDRAEKKLDEIKDDVRVLWSSGDEPIDAVSGSEVVASPAWNGRAYPAKERGSNIEIVWADAPLHVSWWYILDGAPNTRAAEAFLYFTQEAEQQKTLAEISSYAGGNTEVLDLVDSEVADSLATNPENFDQTVEIDEEWWSENVDELQTRWDAWKSSN
ncbi:ABC transporter substrate-binding protein [Leucobacter sp. GX24907]